MATADETLAWLRQQQINVFAARVEGAICYTEVDYRGPAALVLGSEAEGLSDLWASSEVTAIRLPMLGIADSLNVSVAAGVLFYEARRQRVGVAATDYPPHRVLWLLAECHWLLVSQCETRAYEQPMVPARPAVAALCGASGVALATRFSSLPSHSRPASASPPVRHRAGRIQYRIVTAFSGIIIPHQFASGEAPGPLNPSSMQHNEILAWLRETDPARLGELWQRADQTRQQFVGGEVHLRGLVEISNYCVRLCAYCGLRAGNKKVTRYRMTEDEILACVHQAAEYGYGTTVLQAGEDPALDGPFLEAVVRRIRLETPLAVTLSFGERSDDELRTWREAGADRYLLRFETSNRQLYERIHPPRPGHHQERPRGHLAPSA